MKSKTRDIILAIGLTAVLLLLSNPMIFYDNFMGLSALLVILVLLFGFFSIFIWKDEPADEREEEHKQFSARVAYLAGTAVMIVGVIIQTIQHQVDLWLVVALIVMILGKLFAQGYSEKNR